jgi:hypothetical protein
MRRITATTIILICFYTLSQGQIRNLDYYLKEGLSRSPLLKDYANQYSSVAFDSALVRAVKKPQAEARSVLQYIPVYGNFGYDEVVTDHGNYQGMVGVSQDILRGKEVGNKLEALGIQRRTLANTSKITTNELNRLITGQYLSSFSVCNDLTFNISFLQLLISENEIVKQLAGKGIYKQTDWLSLQVETQTQEFLVRRLKSDYESSLRQLNVICGIDDTTSYNLSLPEISVTGAPDIAKSPGYAQYGLDSLRIQNEKTSVDIRYRPKVSWFADAGFLTHDLTAFYTHFGYSAGLSVSIPIYDGNQRNLEKKKLDIEEKTRSNYRDNFHVKYNQEILQLTREITSEKEILSGLETQLATSENLLKALKTELDAGLIQMIDYLSSVKNYRIINKALSDSRIRILQLTNELNYIINQ